MKSRKTQQVRSEETTSSAPRVTSALHFTPELVLAGICFHLKDEGLVQEITAESIRRATVRMQKERLDLCIAREYWECMDHRERLNWLLSESHTVMSLAPGGVATLHRNDEE